MIIGKYKVSDWQLIGSSYKRTFIIVQPGYDYNVEYYIALRKMSDIFTGWELIFDTPHDVYDAYVSIFAKNYPQYFHSLTYGKCHVDKFIDKFSKLKAFL